MKIDGVEVKLVSIDPSEEAIKAYIAEARAKVKGELKTLTIKPKDDENVALVYEAEGEKFERIRRITGYLVGTTDRWNNAKKAEERDRVTHSLANDGGNHGNKKDNE